MQRELNEKLVVATKANGIARRLKKYRTEKTFP